MSDFRIEFDWESAPGVRAPELRATWARWMIRVNGSVVTLLADHRTRGMRDGVYGPLYPLAEWLATNWWSLLYELRGTRRDRELGVFSHRHSIVSAAEGFAVPDLTFRRVDTNILLQWQARNCPQKRVQFLASGRRRVPVEVVALAFEQFITAVVQRLDDQGVGDTLLQDEWKSLQALTSDEREFCEAAGSLGLDPFQLSDDQANGITAAKALLPAELSDDFYQAATPSRLDEQAKWVRDASDWIAEQTWESARLKETRGNLSAPVRTSPPWKRGYELAQRFRNAMGLAVNDAVHCLAEFTGSTRDLWLHRCPQKRSEWERSIQAVSGDNRCQGFAVVTAARRRDSQQFAICRGLGEYLTSGSQRLQLVSMVDSDRQRQNRAFAAELLMPAELLRRRCGGEATVGTDEVAEWADERQVSTEVIRHQLRNHRIAEVVASA